ncbi:protein transport protein YIF1 [Nematocida major]|uniref:protein transport protein YIF1 n=1 Tax=Nematocida major TaxID=1912982 RepID=UPI0020089131|nr:protein transport protein YIF1 [Nematocida major]KAH9385157.1 protein transport protein YIF1 [Nematocida major]
MSHSLQMDMQKHALNLGASYINRAVSFGRFDSVKRYFQIDNSYLLRKMLLIFYPYSIDQWMHCTNRDISAVPVSQPDLYIPLMSVITYILFVACELEVEDKFEPETLGKITTKSLVLALLEAAGIKAGSFFFEATALNITDIVSFIGYKYVTIIAIKIFTKILNVLIAKILLIYLMVSFALFLGRSLKHFLISNEHEITAKKRKMYFLFFIVILECLLLVVLK